MPDSALPPNLRGKKHWDWPTIAFKLPRQLGGKRVVLLDLKKVPRGATAYKWGKPKLLLGNAEMVGGAPKPINPAGTFQVSYFPDAPWWAKPFAWYVSASGKRSAKDGKFTNFRLGTRWDDVDDYVNCTFVPLPSRRRFTGGNDQDTSTGPAKP